jgi:hypothetical protein
VNQGRCLYLLSVGHSSSEPGEMSISSVGHSSSGPGDIYVSEVGNSGPGLGLEASIHQGQDRDILEQQALVENTIRVFCLP